MHPRRGHRARPFSFPCQNWIIVELARERSDIYARCAEGRAIVIALVAGFLLVAAALFAGLWWRLRMALREAVSAGDAAERRCVEFAALLATAPVAVFRWRDGTDPTAEGRLLGFGADLSYRAFAAALDPADAARLASAIKALRGTRAPFSAALAAADGTAYQLDGIAAADGDCAVWVADVSALRRAERAHADTTAAAGRMREMLDALPLPAWRRDAALRIVDCNAAFAAALDLPREAVLANRSELVPPADPSEVPALARAAAAGEAQRGERHIVIGGSRRLLELAEAPASGGGTIGFALDRTDLESAESELARHVNAHGQVLESINAAVAIFGADKRLSFFNSAFARLWGIEEDWLAGEPSLDELLERLREHRRVPEYADFRAFKRQQLEMFTSLIEPQSELMHLPDDRTLSLSVSPHPLGGLIFVYEDVTDRLALERSYNTLIEVQRETLDNLFEGIAVFGSDGRLKLYNPAYGKFWQLSEADLSGEPHVTELVEKTRGFYDDGDWPTMRDGIISQIAGQTHWTGPLDRLDGSVLQMATVPLPDGNLLQTCLDVTDTARVERALRERNEALETADRLKSEFIANVSYELRTPLNAIIGFAEILTNQYFGPLSPRQLEYSRGILDSSHRLMTLINDILDLATIEAGYMALETAPIDVHDMLDAVMTLTRERARAQNLALTLSCPPDIGAIAGDERRLKQAVFNLVSNAIKFTPAGGSVRIEARIEEPQGDLLLAVADTGIGIPAADRERVFEKFERVNPHARDSGAGLGLSLVKSLLELHGGTVAIESEPGYGTTIRCRLPAAMRRSSANRAAAPQPAQ
jgi:signal transduction histidine kinase